MKFINVDNIGMVESFIRLYGEKISRLAAEADSNIDTINFHHIRESDNLHRDIMVSLGRRICISEKEIERMNLTMGEVYAVIAHEIGHIIYNAPSFNPMSEQQADSVAMELGLGRQMISVLEKLLHYKKSRMSLGLTLTRIHYLQNMALSRV